MRIALYTTGLALLAGAALLAWRPGAPEPGAFRPRPATQDALPSLAPAAAIAPTVTSAPVVSTPSLSEQVDRLAATRDPVDAMAAYRLLSGCATFNRDGDRLVFEQVEHAGAPPGFRNLTPAEKAHDATLCAGMTERMRLARLDYLATAARAGVDGAAIQMAGEGPFGDPTALTTRPNDPLVLEWKNEVLALLARAAEDADLGVLEYVSVKHVDGDALFDRNPALAYRYGVAKGLIYRDLAGAGDTLQSLQTLQALYAPDGAQMTGIGAELGATQRNEELAAATRIAGLARMRRQQAGAR